MTLRILIGSSGRAGRWEEESKKKHIIPGAGKSLSRIFRRGGAGVRNPARPTVGRSTGDKHEL